MRDNNTITKQDSNQYTILLHHFSYITNLAHNRYFWGENISV